MTGFAQSAMITCFSSEYASDLIGLPGKAPLLSWQVSSSNADSEQLSFEIEAARDVSFSEIFATRTEKSSESQYLTAPGGEMTSREVRYFRVRIETQDGWTDWSKVLRFEAGLLDPADFVGLPIGDKSQADDPVTLLRREFSIGKQVAKARLYATAHGVFNLFLNGQRISDEILAPGFTSYWHRLLVTTHDVTEYLQPGANAWGVELADGWFRGKFGFVNTRNIYGDQTAFLGQIEVFYTDGTSEVIGTDLTWKTGQGEVQFSGIYDGSIIDFNRKQIGWNEAGFDASAWSFVHGRIIDKSVLEPRTAEPVRIIRETDVAISEHLGAVRINTHQNISGWLKLTVKGEPGTKITLKHAEILENSGDLHTKALRHAKATEVYILADSQVITLEPSFTFHGFQFADIHVEGALEILEIKAIAISSDLPDRGQIETSHEGINKLASNIYWSLRDNFVSLPTDCPQRDERMGWTGDAMVISHAAHTMLNDYQFFKSWLKDLAHDQLPSGEVPVVVPDILAIQFPEGMFFSVPTVGWGDAATIIPWSMYERFGDREILSNQLHSMREWVRCLSELREGELIPESARQLGDWLDPDAPPSRPADAKVSGRFMANAYLAYSALLLSRTEEILGHTTEARANRNLFEQTRDAVWAELAAEAATTPTGAAILLQFDLVPAESRSRIADELAASVVETEGLIRTGFLGTPVILDAMSQNGNIDAAYVMLLRTKIRSWLYPLSVGATSMWERWEAIHEDGSIDGGEMDDATEGSEGSMISFNHYAYGAVLDWIYRNVAGLNPSGPGYRETSIAPKPHTQLTSAKASIETGYGRLAIDWETSSDEFSATVEIPFGVTASLDLPATTSSRLSVNGAAAEIGSRLTHGTHSITLSNPRISA